LLRSAAASNLAGAFSGPATRLNAPVTSLLVRAAIALLVR
jgi:hypothetical protein